MTSPRPPVLEKGAHSAPTNTMLRRSSAWTESAWRPRAAGARGAAARAARLKEGRTARRPTAGAVDPAASALADMSRGLCGRERSAWGNDGISERKSFSTAKRRRFDIWHRIANHFLDSERSLFRRFGARLRNLHLDRFFAVLASGQTVPKTYLVRNGTMVPIGRLFRHRFSVASRGNETRADAACRVFSRSGASSSRPPLPTRPHGDAPTDRTQHAQHRAATLPSRSTA